ncbi:MAG: hypothetical protein CUN56_00525 [Phototrophicales bacterium]|nr:MAG: hypothetical protein CUN56_00525 [Phototrophicales bacterium]
MKTQKVIYNTFNRGVVSPSSFSRFDIERIAISAETLNNIIPSVLGPASFRPGFSFIDDMGTSGVLKKFVPNTADSSVLFFSDDGYMKVITGDSVITRPSVSASISDGDFDGSPAGAWTFDNESGASASISGGYLNLTGNGYNSAAAYQQIYISSGEVNTIHGISIIVDQGEVRFKVGTTSDSDDVFTEAVLQEGNHSIGIDPNGNGTIYIRFENSNNYTSKVESVSVESSGHMRLATGISSDKVNSLRIDQSIDVAYVSVPEHEPLSIQRWDANSWSVIKYRPVDGPFRSPNTSPIRVSPSAKSGDITLTATEPLFTQNDVGKLFRITSDGQSVSVSASGEDQWTDSIRVVGVGSTRSFDVSISGIVSGTVVTLQRSIGDESSWTDYKTYSSDTTVTISDGLDNQIVYYRIGIGIGDYGGGTVDASLEYTSGGKVGVCRIVSYTSSTSVGAIVLTNFGGVNPTTVWDRFAWVSDSEQPTAVKFYGGRLVWGAKGKVYFSYVDDFLSFDDSEGGDSDGFTRTLPGPYSGDIRALLDANALLVFTSGGVYMIKPPSIEESITGSNAKVTLTSSQGAADIAPEMIDFVGVFVQAERKRVYDLSYDGVNDGFAGDDMTKFVPDVFTGIRSMTMQRQPDTRVTLALDDGTAAVMVYDSVEKVRAWSTMSTDGSFIDFQAITYGGVDALYALVCRNINGADKYYLEKMAYDNECVGGTLNKNIDCHYVYQGASASTITGLDHLEGEEVVVWADGVDLSRHNSDWSSQTTYTVSSGAITLPRAVSNAVIGLPYSGRWKPVVFDDGSGAALSRHKRVVDISLLLKNTHVMGVRFGDDFAYLNTLPLIEDYRTVSEDHVYSFYQHKELPIDGETKIDARPVIECYSPRPCTVLSVGSTYNVSDA